MRNPVRLRLLAGLLAVPLLITACGGNSGDSGDKSTTGGKSGGSFSLYIGEPENPLVPRQHHESEGIQVVNAPLDRSGAVLRERAPGRVRPASRESIESDDNTNWTIKLKDGWTFHDGTPVTRSPSSTRGTTRRPEHQRPGRLVLLRERRGLRRPAGRDRRRRQRRRRRPPRR